MAEVNDALDDAMAGHGRLVMLASEPGIGKTSIAHELTAHASDLGAKVLGGWCYEREGAPPYWPWVQPIKASVADAPADQLGTEIGSAAADIADLIPEIRQELPDLETPPALDPEPTRFQLFNSITAFLKTVAQPQSLVVVLDDLHWSDTPSLLLLEFLAQKMAESNVLVIGTYRDVEVTRRHPLTESLARMSRNASFHRLGLDGLESGDAGEYVRESGGENASSKMLEAIHTHTEGYPLFIRSHLAMLSGRSLSLAFAIVGAMLALSSHT
jgi:predicted ATPase|tara:strand:+ start:937 stop:1749 length:813 start_codon:yes stop_codon:yes gene_type:complete